MALRILFLIIGATIAINLVLASVSLITGVNLYKKYGKQMIIGAAIFVLFIAAVYTAVALIGLK